MYLLKDLLTKLGAPEVEERGRIEWHYFTGDRRETASFAEVRMEAAGERLVAELKQVRENAEDDDGNIQPQRTDRFFLYAERTARPEHYRVTRIVLDGIEHAKPSKAVCELGLSVFHARALDISIRMVEQAFNKQDMFDRAEASIAAHAWPERLDGQRPESSGEKVARATAPEVRSYFLKRAAAKKPPEAESFGVVVPFRPRSELRA